MAISTMGLYLAVTGLQARADVYVSLNGDDSDGLTWATAKKTLQAGFDLAAANDTIHVAGGQTFAMAAAAVWPAFGNITLRGGYEAVSGVEPGANDPVRWPTVLKPTSGTQVRVLTISTVIGASIENLTLREGDVRTSPAYGGAVYASAVTGLTVRNCRFLRNKLISGGNSFGGGIAALNSSGLITNSVFIGNYAVTSTGHGTGCRGGAIYLSGGTWTLRDLQVLGNFTGSGSGSYRGSGYNMAGGIYLGGAGVSFAGKNLMVVNNDGGGIQVDAGGGTLENLTVSGNDLSGISVAAGAASGTTIRNSILYGNRDDFSGTAPKLHYNTIGDGTQAGSNGNLADDPNFVFPLFYLAAGSTALNSGTGTVTEAGLTGTTVLTTGIADSGTVSRGYHFTAGVVWDLDLYVAKGGSGDGSSVENPLGSITAALAQAALRTRIHIATGTYDTATETFPLTIEGKTIQLLGTDAAATIINASGSIQRLLLVQDAPFGDIRVEGLTLRGAYASAKGSGGGIRVDGATFSILNSVVRDNTCYTFGSYGGGLYAQDATVFIGETDFLNNTSRDTRGHITAQGGGVGAYSAVTMKIHNGIYSGNTSYWQSNLSFATTPLYHGGAVWLGRGFYQIRSLLLANNIGGGIFAAASTTISAGASPGISSLENLTVATNNAIGIQVHASALPYCTIRNAIAYGNIVSNVYGSLPTVFVNSCIGTNPRAGVDGNISGNPLFVNAAGGDFRLQSAYGRLGEDGRLVRDPVTSPCIDAGTNQLWMTDAIDVSGLPRIQQGRPGSKPNRVDIGAHESPAIPPQGTVMLVL